ncbi:Protein phosphatase methylesterase 1 [Dichanthelium oligosanthes]|uniref:Protein phosphatase methylesterase 1 n=1 Tax=Dichanthelium oligosanthes TaxID=888268 RepID=A0A1E5UP57_9POAL|nr:Protein phosphatase methylesterase 1 [Dichanthelium oligosanthes]
MEPAPLSSLKEEEPTGEDSSAFSAAAVPPRPATHSHSLHKYAPLDWSSYFDEERRVAIPGTDDVRALGKQNPQGLQCVHSRIGGPRRVLPARRRLLGVSPRCGLLPVNPLTCFTGELRVALASLLNFQSTRSGDFPPLGHMLNAEMLQSNCFRFVPETFAIDLYSWLSFALAANQMKGKARVVAMDLRGHGKSTTSNDLDLSIETLTNDVIAVIRTMYGNSPPAIILVGHSMGGSVAVHVAARKEIRNLHGLVVVDVVEGTAMASLVHMQKILSNRAQHFPSIEKAIEWSVKGGPLRNTESARVSIPSTLKYDESRECYTYRTPLEQTEKYWKGWYEGLSEKFLSCPVQKILLLAGTDRLDRALTIGQMQGKFQMVVIRHTGHAIQEDVPEEFASHILNFISRNKIGPNGVEIPGLIKKWGH